MRREEYKVLRNCVVGREWERWRGKFRVERIGLGWGFCMYICIYIAGRVFLGLLRGLTVD